MHWITKRDRFGSDPEKPLRRRRRASQPARQDADACSKVPGLCSLGLQGTTLLTICSAVYGPSRAGNPDDEVHHAHPGELVPGSMYLGRGGESVEDVATVDGDIP